MSGEKAPATCKHSSAVHRAFTDHHIDHVAAHLRSCESCSAEWQSLQELASAARQMRTSELSSATKDELRARLLIGARALAKESPPRRSRSKAIGATIALALVAAAIALVVVRPWSVRSVGPARQIEVSAYRATIHEQPGARFAIVSPQPDEVVRLHEGTITVHVAPLMRGERFRVLTQDAEVEVHGTVFDVSANQEQLALVTVVRGRVEVRGRGAMPVILAEGGRWVSSESRNGTAEPRTVPQLLPAPLASAAPGKNPIPVSEDRQRAGHASARSRVPHENVSPEVSATARVTQRPSPSSAEIAFQEGWAALRSGDAAAASRSFEAVPHDTALGQDAAFWRGVALARAGRTAKASQALESFVVMFPTSPHRDEALVTLGLLLHRLGNNAAAAERFGEAQNSSNGEVRERARRGLSDVQRE
jgi:TolA-binding protein